MTEATKKSRKRKPMGPFSNELLDQLLAQASGKDADNLLGESGLIGQLKKQLAERMLAAELTHHLASEDLDEGAGNHGNGSSPKTVLTPSGALDLKTGWPPSSHTWWPNTRGACPDLTTM